MQSSKGSVVLADEAARRQIEDLLVQIQERDYEINMLLSFLKKSKASVNTASSAVPSTSSGTISSAPQPGGNLPKAATPERQSIPTDLQSFREQHRDSLEKIRSHAGASIPGAPVYTAEQLSNRAILEDRNRAFDVFRKSYRKNQIIEEQKATLKEKFEDAKRCKDVVNEARKNIDILKARVESIRAEKALQGLLDRTVSVEQSTDPEELRSLRQINAEKRTYKENFERLRTLKQDITNIQAMLEKSRLQLQRDFEQWHGLALQQGSLDPTTTATPSASASSVFGPSSSQLTSASTAASVSRRPVDMTSSSLMSSSISSWDTASTGMGGSGSRIAQSDSHPQRSFETSSTSSSRASTTLRTGGDQPPRAAPERVLDAPADLGIEEDVRRFFQARDSLRSTKPPST